MSAHLTALAEDFEEAERGQRNCGSAQMTQQSHKGLRVVVKNYCSPFYHRVGKLE